MIKPMLFTVKSKLQQHKIEADAVQHSSEYSQVRVWQQNMKDSQKDFFMTLPCIYVRKWKCIKIRFRL